MPVLLLFLLLLAPLTVEAAEPDWTPYAALLGKHLSQGEKNGVALNLVDYPALKADPAWPAVVQLVEGFPLERLSSRPEQLAFYINTYNILALKMVVDHWPLASIKEAGSLFSQVWGKPAGRLASGEVTLEGIEHQVLRPMKEPRIHFAIVCASVSCPDLRAEPYTAARLDAQLQEQVKRFLANPAKGLRLAGEEARVSKIFSWFEEDFGGAAGVLAFLGQQVPAAAGVRKVDYLPYDWGVNAK